MPQWALRCTARPVVKSSAERSITPSLVPNNSRDLRDAPQQSNANRKASSLTIQVFVSALRAYQTQYASNSLALNIANTRPTVRQSHVR